MAMMIQWSRSYVAAVAVGVLALGVGVVPGPFWVPPPTPVMTPVTTPPAAAPVPPAGGMWWPRSALGPAARPGLLPAAPPPAAPGPPVGAGPERVLPGGGRVVAVSFDDGPDPRWTPQVLALLHRFGVHATFCVIGRQAVLFPGLVARIAAEGHRLCNHTFDHDEHLAARPVAVIEADIQADTAAIHRAAPQAVVGWFRAPGGSFTGPLDELLAGLGLRALGWSVDPDDWRRPGASAIVARILDEVRPGSIILLHDGGGQRGETITALARLLPALLARGYRFTQP